MAIPINWPQVRTHFRRSWSTNLHVCLASTGSDGSPCASPIGSFFINTDGTAFYFEKYPKSLPAHAAGTNPQVCILAVNSSRWFWLKSLFTGKFSSPPGMKLYGRLGARRQATPAEIERFERRMRLTRSLRGHQYLWASMAHVREVHIDRVAVIRFGEMGPA
jgi:hypothetical protein